MHSWLTHPWTFSLLVPVVLLLGLLIRSNRQRKKALAFFANPALGRGFLDTPKRGRGASKILLFSGLVLLIVGIAGPRWGEAAPEETLGGQDVVVVLDSSRSMLAEQPSRQELSRRALRDLGEAFKKRGGHRIALVVFAAQAKLVVPLTRDYDHFLEALVHFDAAHPPRELSPPTEANVASGTRIGAALQAAVQAQDPSREIGRHVLLVSDGDDPARDEEWIAGADAARQKSIRVHTVGVGDAHARSRIPFKDAKHATESRDGWLWFNGDYVRTSLQEELLQEIARRTGGQYLSAGTKSIALSSHVRDILERSSSDDRGTSITGRTPASQHLGFLFGAFVSLSLSLVLEKLHSAQRGSSFLGEPGALATGVSFALVALLLIAADVQHLLRRGDEAFSAGKYEAALELFERAESHTSDPGLVAFNKAAALYRLGRFREAQLHYQRCLEDDQVPALRKARALYDLGNCLVRQAGAKDRRLLAEAIRAYELSLEERAPEPLRDDARHNLELTRLLLQAAPAGGEENALQAGKDDPTLKKQADVKNGQEDSKGGKLIDGAGDKKDGKQPQHLPKKGIPGGGTSPSLIDSDQPMHLSVEDTLKLLSDAVRRIQDAQREAQRGTDTANRILKNW